MIKIISKLTFYIVVGAGVLGILSFGADKFNLALAQNIDDSGVSYPIKELGNCADKSECKTYCDKKENQGACLDFAGQKGMMKKADIDQAKKMLKLAEDGTNTPGNCRGEDECDAYCGGTAHLDECVDFGEKAGLISPEEVKMIKKTGGKGPGGCKGKEKCDAFCQQENNFDVCLEFGHENGMMNDEEYAMAKKSGLKMMKEGGPGGCKGKDECDAFCGDEKNFDTCLDFGKQNGMMTEEEYAMAKKMGPKIMNQGGPGGCKEKDECKSFCDNPVNGEECVKFAISSGMMSEEEAAKMKDRGFMAPPKDALGANGEFMGPGGCKTQEECAAFCSDTANEKVCSMFGAGPPLGQDNEGQDRRQIAPGTAPGKPPAGPGGCDSPTACMKFCSESYNQETCMNFAPPRADQAPGDLQVPRIEPGQDRPQQSGSPDDRREGESGQDRKSV